MPTSPSTATTTGTTSTASTTSTTSERDGAEAHPKARTGRGPVRRTPLSALTEMRWAAAAVALFLIGLGLQLSGAPAWSWWTGYLACYVAGGWEPGLAGVRALRERTLDVDLLMVVAAIGAAAIGQVTDGALLIVIFAGSGALEALATARTEDSVRGLLDLAPDTATLLDSDGERTVTAADLVPGDVIVVRPGEQVAADGQVVAGASEIDQASITGEPLPVNKTVGDEVFAGTLNGTGSVRIRVARRAEDSVVARIATLVEQASRTKATTQLFVEKIEQRYSLGMVAATVAVFAVPLLAGEALSEALLRAMTFMIVASPCAVVLATMPPLLAAIANAGRHGVLVKSAVVMEQLGTTTRVAFDKTGTLTRAHPELATIAPLADHPLTEDEVLGLAAAVEHPSEHPLAGAIASAARQRGVQPAEIRDFSATPGRGVTGRVDGHIIEVSSPVVLTGEPDDPAGTGPLTPRTGTLAAARLRVDAVTRQGHTAVVVSRDGLPVAVLGITDQIREDAAATVAELAALTGSPPVLLTGDNAAAGRRLAETVGITDVHAELLPEGKVDAVRALVDAGARVMVVGDGVNDAPALAAANTGIAMGVAGADLAVHSADAVVARDELAAIPAVIALSRRARTVVTANLIIAAVFIVGLVLWDLLGHLPLPLGVAGHEGSTVIVGLNGLRLLRHSAWRRAADRPGTAGRPSTR